MRTAVILTMCFLVSAISPAYSGGRKLAPGKYKRFHQNAHFRLVPPNEFDKMRPEGDGVKLTNSTDNIAVMIHAFRIENPKNLSDYDLLMQFKNPSFRKEFFKNIDELSAHRIKKHRFRNINRKDVFEVTIEDPKRTLKPLKAIIFFEYGKVYRVTLEAQTMRELEKHSHYIDEVFGIIGLLE